MAKRPSQSDRPRQNEVKANPAAVKVPSVEQIVPAVSSSAPASVGTAAADAGGTAPGGGGGRVDDSLLRFLITLAVDKDLRARFTASPRTTLNEQADLTEDEKQVLLAQDALALRDALGAGPLQHGISAREPLVRTQTDGGTQPPNGRVTPTGRRRIVRVEVEFND